MKGYSERHNTVKQRTFENRFSSCCFSFLYSKRGQQHTLCCYKLHFILKLCLQINASYLRDVHKKSTVENMYLILCSSMTLANLLSFYFRTKRQTTCKVKRVLRVRQQK